MSGLRFVHWCDAYWPIIGGTEVASVRLLAGLQERGHEPMVMTDSQDEHLPERQIHQGIVVHRLPFRHVVEARDPARFFDTLQRALDIVREFQPGLAHLASIGPAALFCTQLNARLGLPLVFTHQMSGMWTEEVSVDQLLHRAASQAAWVLFPSEAMRAEAAGVGVRPARSSVIYNGLEVPPPVEGGLPWDPPVLLALGRLSSEKGFDVLLRALGLLRDDGITLRAILAGEGAERRALEVDARSRGLDMLTFAGWIRPEAVPDLLSSATIVVVPSRDESFGLVALEAHMAGRPVLATSVGGLPEIVEDGKTGILVEPEDPRRLADAVASMLSDRANLEKMGRRARRRVEGRFSITTQVSGYERIFEMVSEEGNG